MISLAALKSLPIPIPIPILDADVDARAVYALDRQAELQELIDSLRPEQFELTESLWADPLED